MIFAHRFADLSAVARPEILSQSQSVFLLLDNIRHSMNNRFKMTISPNIDSPRKRVLGEVQEPNTGPARVIQRYLGVRILLVTLREFSCLTTSRTASLTIAKLVTTSCQLDKRLILMIADLTYKAWWQCLSKPLIDSRKRSVNTSQEL